MRGWRAMWMAGGWALVLSCGGSAGGPPAAGSSVSADEAPYAPEPRSEAPEGFWEHWGDGRAELAGYALRQRRYGELRRGEAVLIFVTESFTAEQRVKSDGGHADEYPVLKLNEVRDFQTGIYDYHLMTSSFLRLDGRAGWGVPTKVSMSMQEWCGSVHDQLIFYPERFERQLHSYFDGEADASATRSFGEGALFADALPMLVRGLTGDPIARGERRELALWPRLSRVRLEHSALEPAPATIERSAGVEPVQSVLGRVPAETWTVRQGEREWRYTVEAAAPRRLLGWRDDRGEEAVLTGVMRSAYWQQNGEGQERLRAELGLPVPHWPEPRGREAAPEEALR